MTEQKLITEAQREARRANGRKARGPKTEEGKARSRQNAIRHGGYARVIHVIGAGPMEEDMTEVDSFYKAVIEDLDPGESPLLRHRHYCADFSRTHCPVDSISRGKR